jgi:hypothetical protein
MVSLDLLAEPQIEQGSHCQCRCGYECPLDHLGAVLLHLVVVLPHATVDVDPSFEILTNEDGIGLKVGECSQGRKGVVFLKPDGMGDGLFDVHCLLLHGLLVERMDRGRLR